MSEFFSSYLVTFQVEKGCRTGVMVVLQSKPQLDTFPAKSHIRLCNNAARVVAYSEAKAGCTLHFPQADFPWSVKDIPGIEETYRVEGRVDFPSILEIQ